jgi:hypothetical protein
MDKVLPLRSEAKADQTPLLRAEAALKVVRKSLKGFAQSASVQSDPKLTETVRRLRRRIKKARRATKALLRKCEEEGTY